MRLPGKFSQFLGQTGGMTRFTGRFFSQEFRPRFEFRELITQCYIIGYNSLPLVGLTGFISEDMEALKHDFLLRGYFRKRDKQQKKNDTVASPPLADN